MTIPRRHKGKGVKTRVLRLTDAGIAAFERFAELECWGPFSNSSMLKSWHRACDAAGLPRVRVSDLRHSFATETYRVSGDPKATAAMLTHSGKSHMMDRYTIGAWISGCSWRRRPSTRRRRPKSWQKNVADVG